jgi:hypothetical protein
MEVAVRSTGAHPWRRAHALLALAATVFATPGPSETGRVQWEIS